MRRNWQQKTFVGFSLVAEFVETEFHNSVTINDGFSGGLCDKPCFGREKLVRKLATECNFDGLRDGYSVTTGDGNCIQSLTSALQKKEILLFFLQSVVNFLTFLNNNACF